MAATLTTMAATAMATAMVMDARARTVHRARPLDVVNHHTQSAHEYNPEVVRQRNAA